MSFDTAIRLTEILLALAFIQQSIEHIYTAKDQRNLFIPKIIFSILLLFGLATKWICLLLFINGILILKRFDGAYNGGSDRMGLLTLSSLCLIHFIPVLKLQEFVFGYLALQTILSYFISGFCKITNKDWWNGKALEDLFRFSIYPASEALRAWAERPKILCLASWLTILFELFFPLSLLNQTTLVIGLVLALSFHLVNIYLFGLNRFLWVWLAAYPSLLWLQGEIINY